MQTRTFSQKKYRCAGFTLVELLTVIGVVLVLVSLLLPALSGSLKQSRRTSCINNLRQIGIAMQGFAQDHNDHFPMQIPSAAGGSFTETGEHLAASPLLSFSARHFQVASNELGSPQILACPADRRAPAMAFSNLDRRNISYWVYASAIPNRVQQYLAGDRNATQTATNGTDTNLIEVTFDRRIHEYKGNVLFVDGHVDLVTRLELRLNSKADSETPPVPQRISSGSEAGSAADHRVTSPLEKSARSSSPSAKGSRGSAAITNALANFYGLLGQSNVADAIGSKGATIVPGSLNKGTKITLSQASPADLRQKSDVALPAPSRPDVVVPDSEIPRRRKRYWALELVEWMFIVGLFLFILGLAWYYLHRRRKQRHQPP